MNLSMIGNLISTLFVGIAVWLSAQWEPNPNGDIKQLVALGLTYGAGLLTAISSQWSVHIEKESDSEIDGEDNHD